MGRKPGRHDQVLPNIDAIAFVRGEGDAVINRGDAAAAARERSNGAENAPLGIGFLKGENHAAVTHFSHSSAATLLEIN